LTIAKAEMRAGAREIGGNNLGPYVAKYLKPSGLKPPQPWCAAFASWCLLQSTEKNGLKRLPYFLSAREMFNWAQASGFLTKDPKPGNLVFFARGGLFSWKGHCGIVASVTPSKIVTIEGNRTSRVQTFAYNRTRIPMLLGFAGIICEPSSVL
jgi:uncharacterized protein (TIGR02594 family)